jgi:integrase
MKLPEITSANITALLLEKQKDGYAHASVVKMYTVLNLLFKMAYLNDVIPKNPMDKVQRPKPRKEEIKGAEVEAFTAEELRYIISCLEREPLKWRALIRLLIDTGIRVGECCGLQWEDVDFATNTITVAHTLGYTKAKGIYLDTPKSGKARTIDVDPAVMAMLKRYHLEQSSKALSRFVFTQEGSADPMHPQSPRRYLSNFGKRYGVDDLHPHKLRHSFASVAITSGADIASVSEKLGHSDKAVTLRMYTHADQESMKRASNIFRDAIKNA